MSQVQRLNFISVFSNQIRSVISGMENIFGNSCPTQCDGKIVKVNQQLFSKVTKK